LFTFNTAASYGVCKLFACVSMHTILLHHQQQLLLTMLRFLV
jgi:hypothetical protein